MSISTTLPVRENSVTTMKGPAIKVLHVAAECYPLAKTGGLGDVVGALAVAQRLNGLDARVALPGYRGLQGRLEHALTVAALEVSGFAFFVVEGLVTVAGPARRLPVYLFCCADLFDRGGDPYRDESGQEHSDNALRFGCFAEAVTRMVCRREVVFTPQLVHLHDWQSGGAAARLAESAPRPATVFTIHNLAYQGLFDREVFRRLAYPEHWWSPQGVEFWGQGSFMRAGI